MRVLRAHRLTTKSETNHLPSIEMCLMSKSNIIGNHERNIPIALKLAFSLRFSAAFRSVCSFVLAHQIIIPFHLDVHLWWFCFVMMWPFSCFVVNGVVFFSVRFYFCGCNDYSVSVIPFQTNTMALAQKIKVKWLVNTSQWILKSVLSVLFRRIECWAKERQQPQLTKKSKIESREKKNANSISNDNIQNTENDVKCYA